MGREVIIALSVNGAGVVDMGGSGGEVVQGSTAPDALGRWVYQNRKSLGLELMLLLPDGRVVHPK